MPNPRPVIIYGMAVMHVVPSSKEFLYKQKLPDPGGQLLNRPYQFHTRNRVSQPTRQDHEVFTSQEGKYCAHILAVLEIEIRKWRVCNPVGLRLCQLKESIKEVHSATTIPVTSVETPF